MNVTDMTEEGERKRGGDPFWAELRAIQERHSKSCPGGRNDIDRAAFVLMDNAWTNPNEVFHWQGFETQCEILMEGGDPQNMALGHTGWRVPEGSDWTKQTNNLRADNLRPGHKSHLQYKHFATTLCKNNSHYVTLVLVRVGREEFCLFYHDGIECNGFYQPVTRGLIDRFKNTKARFSKACQWLTH